MKTTPSKREYTIQFFSLEHNDWAIATRFQCANEMEAKKEYGRWFAKMPGYVLRVFDETEGLSLGPFNR